MQRLARLATRPPDIAALSGLLLVVCLVLALRAVPAGAQRQVRLYEPKHRKAEELLPLAQTVMAGSGSAAVDPGTNSLVLIGDPSEVSAALALLGSQDRRLQSVVLRYGTRRLRELAVKGLQVRWTAATGGFRLGRVRVAPDRDSAVRAQATDAMHRLIESLDGEMRVLEGAVTRLESGTVLPYAVEGPSGSSTEFVEATSGFEARTRILADGRVQVDLASFAHSLRLDRSLDAMGASTHLILEPGAVVVVGSTSEAGAEDRRDRLEGTRSGQRRDETVLLLRADID